MNRGEEDGVDEEISKGISRLDINREQESAGDVHSNGHSNSLKAKFNQFVLDAKEKARQGLLEEALELFSKAYQIHPSEKLLKRIKKLKEFIKEYAQEEENEEEEEEEEEDDGMVEVGNGFSLAKEISEALYPYQKEGVLWFWKLYQKKQGGILGDDMGLGKTIQVIAFLSGMFDHELIKSVLIVMPVSLITNWEQEFKTWTPGIRVKCFHGSKKERQKNLDKIQLKNGVCLTTYGLVVSSNETLSNTSDGRPFKWDYVILDEGHKIKNPTKTNKNVRTIPARNRFILTGTPIQNNLREMWSLFDYVTQGQLLGSSRTFKQEFENPIVRARERDASAYEKRIGNEMAKSLRKLIDPHFLRRTKAMVLKSKDTTPDKEDGGNATQSEISLLKTPSAALPEKLTRKNDFIIWLHLSETQIQIYSDFLGLERIKELLMSTRSPLAELNVLKKICDHPRLLSAMACSQLGLDDNARVIDMEENKENDDSDMERSLARKYNDGGIGISDSVLIQESGKMVFLVVLLDNLKKEGHRCLVFSQSRKMLDIIQRVITHRGHKVLRIDGTITKTADRQHLITTFQTNPSYTCCLLTTQVGGVGLTLTAADRVVIFDPSWNPATDAQAVDRAYRIGQTRPVVIYRLITCGTIEEKIYRKQIFKDALMKQTTGSSINPFRYFTREDLRELFTLDDPMKSKTQVQLAKMHAQHRDSDEELDKHIDFLHNLNIFGITDHDLMYTQEAVETAEELEEATDAIQARVLRAQSMVAAESNAGGQSLPSVLPAPYQNPKSLLKPIDVQDLVNEQDKKTIQAKIHQFEVFKPTREDTKRFMPHVKKPPMPRASKHDDVIDLCTPPVGPAVETANPKKTPPDNNDVISHQNTIDEDMANLSLTNEKNSSSSQIENDDSSEDCRANGNSQVILDSSPPKEAQDSLNDLMVQIRDPVQQHGSSPIQTRDSPVLILARDSTSPIHIRDSPVPTSTRDSTSPTQSRDSPLPTPTHGSTSPIQIGDSPVPTPTRDPTSSIQSRDSPSSAPTRDSSDYSSSFVQDPNSRASAELGEVNDEQSYSNTNGDANEDEISQSESYQRMSFGDKVNDSLPTSLSEQLESLTEKNTEDSSVEESYLCPITPTVADLPPSTAIDDAGVSSTTPTDDAGVSRTTPTDDAGVSPSSPTVQSIQKILFASPAVYLHEDGKRQTPRRKSSKFRRKSLSQQPFNNIDDSDDDDNDESKAPAPSYTQELKQQETTDSSEHSFYEDAMDYMTPNASMTDALSVFSSRNSVTSSSLNEEVINESFRERLSSTVEGEVNENNVPRKVKRIESTDDEENDSVSNDGSSSEQQDTGASNLENYNSVYSTPSSPSNSSPGTNVETDNDVSEDELMKTKTPTKVLRIESDDEDENPENEDAVERSCSDDMENEVKEDEAEDSEARSSSEDSSAASSQNQEESRSSLEEGSKEEEEEEEEESAKNRTQKRRVKRLDSTDDEDENPENEDAVERSCSDDLENEVKEDEAEDSEARSSSEDSSATSSQNQEESRSSLEEGSEEEEGEEESAKNRTQKRRVKRLDSTDDDDDDESVSLSDESKDGYDYSKDVKSLLSSLGRQNASNSEDQRMCQKKHRCPSGLHQSNVVNIQRCACVLNEAERHAYARNVRLSNEQETFGRHDLALDYLLEALKIDSSDLKIHKRALKLAKLQKLL